MPAVVGEPRIISIDGIEVDGPPSAPTDQALRDLKARVDQLEEATWNARTNLGEAVRSAIAGGVTVTHVAQVCGWSRQWTHQVISRWIRPLA